MEGASTGQDGETREPPAAAEQHDEELVHENHERAAVGNQQAAARRAGDGASSSEDDPGSKRRSSGPLPWSDEEPPPPSSPPHRHRPRQQMTTMISGDGVLLPPRTPAQLASLLALWGLTSAPDLVRPGNVYHLSYDALRRFVQCQALYYGRPVTDRTTSQAHNGNDRNNGNGTGTALRVDAACCDPHCPFRLETIQEHVDGDVVAALLLPPLPSTATATTTTMEPSRPAPLEFQRVVASHPHHCTIRDHFGRPLLVLDQGVDNPQRASAATASAASVTSELLQLNRLLVAMPLPELAQRLHDAYGLDYACSPVRMAELGRAYTHAQQQQQQPPQQPHQEQQPSQQLQQCRVLPPNPTTDSALGSGSAGTDGTRGAASTPPTPPGLLEDRDMDDARDEATWLQVPPSSSTGRGRGATPAKRKREVSTSSSPDPTSRDRANEASTKRRRKKIQRTHVETLALEAVAFSSATGRRSSSVEAVAVKEPAAPATSRRKNFSGGLKTSIRRGPRPRIVRVNKTNSPVPTDAAAPKRLGRPPKARPQEPSPISKKVEVDTDELTTDPANVETGPKRRGRKPMVRQPEPSTTWVNHGHKSRTAPKEVAAPKRRGRKPQIKLAPTLDLPTEPMSSAAEHSTQDQLSTPNVEVLKLPRRRGRSPRVQADLSTEAASTVQGESPVPGEGLPRRRGRWPKKSSPVASAPPAQSSVQGEPSASASDLTMCAAAVAAPKHRGRRLRSEPDVKLTDSPVQDELPTASNDVYSLPAGPKRRGRPPKSTIFAPRSATHPPECLAEASLGQVQAPKRRGRLPKTANTAARGASAETSPSGQDKLPLANEEFTPNTAMAVPATSKRPGRPPKKVARSKSAPPPVDISKQEHQLQDEVTMDPTDLAARKTSTQDTGKQRRGTLGVARGVSSPSRLSLMNPAAVQTLARTTTSERTFDQARTTTSKPMDSLATATLPATPAKSSSADGQQEGSSHRLGFSPPHPPGLIVGQPESQLAEPAAGPLEVSHSDRQVRSPQSVSETFQSLMTETPDSPPKTLGHDLDGQEWRDEPPLNLKGKSPEQTRHGPVASIYSGQGAFAPLTATALHSKMRLTFQGAVFEAVRVPDAVPKDPEGPWFDTAHEYGPWLETGQATNESMALRFSSYPFLFRPSVRGLADEYQNLVSEDVCLPTRMNLDSADSLRKSVDAKLFSLKSHEDKDEGAVEEVNQEHKVYKRSLAAHRRGEEQELLAKLNDDGDAAAHRSRQMWSAAHRCIHRTEMKNHEATAAALAELAFTPVLFESEDPVHVSACRETDCATCRGSERLITAIRETADAPKRIPMPRYRTVEIMPYVVGGNPLFDGHRYRAKMTILKLNELQNSITFVEDFARLGSRPKCLQTHIS